MTSRAGTPVVKTESGVAKVAGKTVYVEGTYEQEDVRMMRVNPATVFAGHAVIVLDDARRVFLYPPARAEARRSRQEIQRCEHRRVRALGTILPAIPQAGAVQNAPCLIDIQSIDVIGP